jgi:hypothetical protein
MPRSVQILQPIYKVVTNSRNPEILASTSLFLVLAVSFVTLKVRNHFAGIFGPPTNCSKRTHEKWCSMHEACRPAVSNKYEEEREEGERGYNLSDLRG